MNFLRQGFRKFSSDKRTKRQTRLKLYHAASRGVSNQVMSSQVTAELPRCPLFCNHRGDACSVSADAAAVAVAGVEGGNVYRTISHCRYGTAVRPSVRPSTSTHQPRHLTGSNASGCRPDAHKLSLYSGLGMRERCMLC